MSIIKDLEELMDYYEKLGVNTEPIDKLTNKIFEADTVDCKLIQSGVCIHLLGEDCQGYDELDDCIIKKAGYYYCGELGELVDRDKCESCNSDQDCGCCDYVISGEAPFNCNICPREKIELEAGIYCVPPGMTDGAKKELVERINANPGAYFNC